MTDKLKQYATAKIKVRTESLFDRHGKEGSYGDPVKWRAPANYYVAKLVTDDGQEHGIAGIDERGNSFYGWYSRKDAIAAAKRFQAKCESLLDSVSPSE